MNGRQSVFFEAPGPCGCQLVWRTFTWWDGHYKTAHSIEPCPVHEMEA